MNYVGISDYVFLLRQQPNVYIQCEEGTVDSWDELEFIDFERNEQGEIICE